MEEHQNIEWKVIWKDEYLKWICAFANTNGGVLYIGIDDDGKVVGVKNATELIYTIPRKVKSLLGIVVGTKLKYKKGLKYICVKVDEHPFPVNLRGKYYIRSGSNTYEAVGMELDRLMLKKIGVKWERVEEPKFALNMIDKYAIDAFKTQALNAGRLTEEQVNISTENFIRNLRLYKNDYLTRAAILLFSKDPENWINGAYIRIGLFPNDKNEPTFEDEIHGPIFLQIQSATDTIFNKYLKKLFGNDIPLISKVALKELITNAVMHKTYESGIPIQISIYRNKLIIWNSASIPEYISVGTLFEPHASFPYNPNITESFYKCGLANSWGLGIEKIKRSCLEENLQIPKFKISPDGLTVRCNIRKEYYKYLKERLTHKNHDISKEELLMLLSSRQDITEEDIKRILSKKI